MPKGLFVTGFTVEEVLAIQQKAKGFLLEGKTIMSWSDGGTSTSKQFAMPIQEVLSECAYALKRLAPDMYGFHSDGIKQAGFNNRYLEK